MHWCFRSLQRRDRERRREREGGREGGRERALALRNALGDKWATKESGLLFERALKATWSIAVTPCWSFLEVLPGSARQSSRWSSTTPPLEGALLRRVAWPATRGLFFFYLQLLRWPTR